MPDDNLPARADEVAKDPMRYAEVAINYNNLAKAMANSQLVPKAFQGRPDDITAAWLLGMELDLPPMTSLTNINMIDGRGSLSANAMRGIAMAKGVVFEVLTATDTRVQMRAKAPGQTAWTTVDWPIERANKMGLTGKSNWTKMPQAMLLARATSELCRLVASNVLMGMPFSTEELTDDGTAEEPKPATTRRRREPIRAEIPEPDLEPHEPQGRVIGAAPETRAIESAPVDDTPADDGEKISANTRAAIMAGFTEIGIKDRNERLDKVGQVVGREVHSVNQLSEVEGRRMVRKLAQIRNPYPQPHDDQQWPEPAQVPAT